MYKEISSFMQKHDVLLLFNQHGFLSGKSTETCGIMFFDYLTRNIDDGNCVDAIFLDYAKALDSIPHSLLLNKLCSYGISGSLSTWLKDYFADRQQVVCVNNTFSDPSSVVSGVIQGSLLVVPRITFRRRLCLAAAPVDGFFAVFLRSPTLNLCHFGYPQIRRSVIHPSVAFTFFASRPFYCF